MHDGCFCLEIENLECQTFEGPDSHGSSTMVNSFGGSPGVGGNGRIGRNVRRKEASELRCLTVKDMVKVNDRGCLPKVEWEGREDA